MKKVFNILTAFLVLQGAAYAQQPATKIQTPAIANVLAQQPAEYEADFLKTMKAMEAFTAVDFSNLLLGLHPQGGDNAAIEYATNSYAFYTMQQGNDEKREVFAQGLISALDKLTDENNKAYILQVMKLAAKNESVDAIVPYLQDEFLFDKAAIALNAIRTDKAAKALTTALAGSSSEKLTTALVAAIGDLKVKDAEGAIIATLTQYTSENYQRTAYAALSKIAGAKSAPFFLAKLKASNYAYDKSNIGGLTLDYAKNLHAEGNDKLALSIATAVSKGADKAAAPTLQVGALHLLSEVDPNVARKQLMKAATSENTLYRAAALEILGQKKSLLTTKALIKSLKKASPAVQESILNFLAVQGAPADAAFIQNNSEMFKDTKAKIALLNALTTLSEGGNAAYLIDQIAGADEATVKVIESLLLSANDNSTIDVVNSQLASADAKTQLVLLNVLATRMNPSSSKAVLPFLKSSDAGLKAAALKALPNVVNADDFDDLINSLGGATEADAKAIQRSMVIALEASADKDAKVKHMAASISRSAAPSAANYFPVFAGVGGAEAMQAVKNYLRNDGLKSKAIAALANWSNPEVLPTLIELSRTEKGSADFGTVFSGLIKQVNASEHTVDQKTLFLKDAFAIAETPAQKNAALGSLQYTGTYQAMMFAAQFLDDEQLKGSATNTAMNIAMDNKSFIGKDVRAILERAMGNIKGSESSYLREAIVRHLAEMPAGEGFVSMFNGKDLSGWKGLVENPITRAKMTPTVLAEKQKAADEHMRKNWSAVNGDLVFSGHGDNIASVKQYGDFEMLVDWKLDPNGKEPDAGVYLRGTPQVQMWDISRTDVGAQVGSGGLYNNSVHARDPLKVADNALGEWNTLKIKMIGEQVWVWLNGELVVDNVTMENYWDRKQPIFPVEQIELQAHGSQVWYRDIYINELEKKSKLTD